MSVTTMNNINSNNDVRIVTFLTSLQFGLYKVIIISFHVRCIVQSVAKFS